MRKIIVASVAILALSSSAWAFDFEGADRDSIGYHNALTDSIAPGKTGDSLIVTAADITDTTNASYVGGMEWIRVWVTGVADSVRVISQMSWDGSHWTAKDSTSTYKTGSPVYAVLYDSLYVRGGNVRRPTTPAPWMRWIIRGLESGNQGVTGYSPAYDIKGHIVGGQ